MNARAIISWVLFLSVETAAQITFKIAGATLNPAHGFLPLVVHALASPWVAFAFTLYFGCFLLWMTILKDSDLGRAFPMTALIYLCTLGAAIFLFHEVLTPVRVLGIGAIIVGVAILVTDQDSQASVIESPVVG